MCKANVCSFQKCCKNLYKIVFSFALQELDRLLKDARAGKTVKEDDIPPQVFVKGAKDTTSQQQQQPQKDTSTAPEPMLVDVSPMQPAPEPPKGTLHTVFIDKAFINLHRLNY